MFGFKREAPAERLIVRPSKLGSTVVLKGGEVTHAVEVHEIAAVSIEVLGDRFALVVQMRDRPEPVRLGVFATRKEAARAHDDVFNAITRGSSFGFGKTALIAASVFILVAVVGSCANNNTPANAAPAAAQFMPDPSAAQDAATQQLLAAANEARANMGQTPIAMAPASPVAPGAAPAAPWEFRPNLKAPEIAMPQLNCAQPGEKAATKKAAK